MMELLLFDIRVVKVLKATNACMHSVMCAERDLDERAVQLRGKVFRLAFKELHNWSKNSPLLEAR